MWLDYDDKYAVSEEGLVMHKKSGRISAGAMMKRGYMKSTYSKDGKDIERQVHRMVAERFIPRIDMPGLVVDHINRNRTDNRACNLRWVSVSANNRNRGVFTNTGQRYIHQKYMVNISTPHYIKAFDTLEEAIQARDKILADYLPPQ